MHAYWCVCVQVCVCILVHACVNLHASISACVCVPFTKSGGRFTPLSFRKLQAFSMLAVRSATETGKATVPGMVSLATRKTIAHVQE